MVALPAAIALVVGLTGAATVNLPAASTAERVTQQRTMPIDSSGPLPDIQIHPWHNRQHHVDDGGFQNIWPPYRSGSIWKGMTWFLGSLFSGKENRLPPVRPVSPDALSATPDQVTFTWIGHATMLIRGPGPTILIDPMFSERASPFTFAGPEREPELPIRMEDLPEIDVVILSHDHYDHLDGASIEGIVLRHNPVFLVPLGLAKYVEGWGSDRVVEMDWWQYVEIDEVRYHCLPAKHFSGRSLLDRDDTLWAGWYVESLSSSPDVFYAGDTAYAPHFGEIRERIGRPDVALLPIGAYLPQWLMHPVHVTPEEAVRAFDDLQASHFLPVHWGTFDLADEPLHAPADTLRRLIREQDLEGRVHLMDIGETWTYESAERSTGPQAGS